MIIKRKYYSSFGNAIREGMIASPFGAVPGAAIGAMIGGRRGALVGMLLGAVSTGVLATRSALKGENSNVIKISTNSKLEAFRENPGKALRDFFAEEEKLIQEYKNLEDDNFKVPQEFYKYLKIRKQFIHTLERWISENPDKLGDWMSVMYIPENPKVGKRELQDMLKFREDWRDDEICYTLLFDPKQSDDKVILYYPFTEKFGVDPTEVGIPGTLKQTILWYLGNEIDFLTQYKEKFDPSGSLVQLYKEYEKFIKQKL